MYNAKEIAKYILDYFSKRGSPRSNLELQHLLYRSWIEYYKKTESFLFDDDITALRGGPFTLPVYNLYRAYGGSKINKKYKTQLSLDDAKILDGILRKLKGRPTAELIKETQKKNSPWDKIFRGGAGNGEIIPFPLLVKECELAEDDIEIKDKIQSERYTVRIADTTVAEITLPAENEQTAQEKALLIHLSGGDIGKISDQIGLTADEVQYVKKGVVERQSVCEPMIPELPQREQ